MKNTEVRKTSDYIQIDKLEEQMQNDLASYQVGTDDYHLSELRLFNMRMNNRGIYMTKQGFFLDCNAFARYVSDKRLKAILMNDNLCLYNQKSGEHQPIEERFLSKCMKEILEESNDKVWSISSQNTYLKAFILNLEHVIRPPYNPDRLLLKNGILDINEFCTGVGDVLHPLSPDEIHMVRIPNNYDPNAKCDLFIKTISDIFNHDTQIINNFQEMLGYLIYYGGEWKVQKFFVFYGKGSNGKSLVCSIIRKLLGEQNCSSTP